MMGERGSVMGWTQSRGAKRNHHLATWAGHPACWYRDVRLYRLMVRPTPPARVGAAPCQGKRGREEERRETEKQRNRETERESTRERERERVRPRSLLGRTAILGHTQAASCRFTQVGEVTAAE